MNVGDDGFFHFLLQINLSRVGPYSGVDDAVSSRVLSEPNIKGYSPLDDPVLRTKRDTSLGVNPDVSNERPIPKANREGLSDSNVLFVDGLPRDCTRREVGRILCYLCVCLYALAHLFFRQWTGR